MSPSLGRILVVDDEAPVREVLSEYFSSQGYTVDEASNGNDAIGTIRRHRPDVVLLDIRMPGLDEIELLLSIATDLGDLPGPDRTLVETALEAARRALPVAS